MKLPDFTPARVLVVGDVMLDRYWHGDTRRISPEAPVPVVRVGEIEERPGGAANVALNVAALGGHPLLLGLVGEDEAAATLARRLDAAGVECRLQPVPGAPTITKLRVISRHQQLIRLDFEDPFEAFDRKAFLARYQAALPDVDVVVLSDYAKGTLRDADRLIDLARAAGRRVLVDPKGADFHPYRGADLITPNLGEFEAVAGVCASEQALVARGLALRAEHALGALLVTRGEHGMTLLREGQPELHLPARAKEVFDVTGAGDTVISTLATALAAGCELPEATALANLAAGIVVGKLGTATVNVAELRLGLLESRSGGRGVMSEEQLQVAVDDARARGERVVMTNGCFDLLHAGHVAYLDEARRLGDRLIVAVNDDASVRRLKGEGRPVNTVERRMAVLAGLASVDWVLPFGEDTPERLICAIGPDVLVKGGDYHPDDIAGAPCVRERGGEVRVLQFLDGHSTSDIIRSIRDEDR